MTTTLKAILYLALLSTIVQYSAATRILDEQPQPADGVLPPVLPPQPSEPLPGPVDPPTDPTIVPSGPVGPVGPTTTTDPETDATAAAPVAPLTPTIPIAANTVATGAPTAAIGAHPLTFFMHDIVGGTKPSVRIVTGVVASTDASGQIPFARPNKDIFPIQGALPLPQSTSNLFNNNNVPYVAGLSGTSTTIVQNNANPNGASAPSGDIPFVNAGDLPAGTTLENLLFGTTTVIDDELTEAHEIGSAVIGRAQGFYLASSQDGTSKTIVMTAVFEEGEHISDTISFFGVHRTAAPESHIAVIGGTGKYENARGFAAVQTLHPGDQGTTDGVETLLQFSVHLS
ncbi:Dirigent protein [Rhynchospora pubera]|uniref:Dirigent protein n=1 Tax=Rhynchospora pubera TaxID=906938 RepID=A0AAV8HPQ7_9POAL|nr:Dirigent protein [Rhynchospora pubera]